MTQIEKLVKEYLEYLEVQRRRSPMTLENYSRYLRRFLAWAPINQPDQINPELVNQFQGYLVSAHFVPEGVGMRRRPVPTGQLENQVLPLKQVTQYYHLIALRGFLKYLAKKNIVSLKPSQVNLGQVPQRTVSVLTDQEVERVLNAAQPKNLAGWRDQAILEILFSTGLRVSELRGLNRADFNQGQLVVGMRRRLVPTQDSHQERLAYLSEPAKKAMVTYLAKRQDNSEALFVNLGRGKTQVKASRLTARSIQRIVKKYAILAGVDPSKVTPSALRHAFAYGLLRAGAEVKTVQKLLGHAHLSTTQIYNKIKNEE